jgi:hypothetical protein|tara:strand:- start:694 stop:1017 length:324 start_codon:yes stop_codon:yes gene_type:complete
VSNTTDIRRFQRWLQAELAETTNIEDSRERERRRLQVEIAIAEAIRFRELIERFGDSVAAPFVDIESPTRVASQNEVTASPKECGECPSCGAAMSQDIDFCPVCGEF